MWLLRTLTAGLLLTLGHLQCGVIAAKEPKVRTQKFDHLPVTLFYFDDSSVILSYDREAHSVWRSDNNGEKWEEIGDFKGQALDMFEHPFDDKKAFVLGRKKTHWVTSDRGETWSKVEVDLPVSLGQKPLSFSAAKPEYVLYAGRGDCVESGLEPPICKDTTFYTKDWFKSKPKELRKDTHGCVFARGTKVFKEAEDSTVICIVDGKDRLPERRKLVKSNNFFDDIEEPKLDGYNVVTGLAGLVTVQKFIVAAVRSIGTSEMALYVSDDAKIWHRAEFPHEHGGLEEGAYTILESTPHSIQVDILTGDFLSPVGVLFSSNSNGTYFTRSLDNTNRSPMRGLVDFEQIEGIEGIILANIVSNADEMKKSLRASKKLQSRISFDDGRAGSWKPLKADGKDLHLHSITESPIGGRLYSSRAPGIVMGVGNTGDSLAKYDEGDTYISDDAGLTWKKTLDEAHRYEFGGAGSIVVAVYDEGFTDKVKYSTDHGGHWKEFDLGIKVRVQLLTTTPDSTSLNFLLLGTDKERKAQMIAIDFKDVFDRKCDDDKEKDFEKWYARYDEDNKPDCLMGHKQYFWRRKKDANCNAGKLYKEPEAKKEDCECQDHDFECDFNFVRSDDDKDCIVAHGAKLPIPPDQCKKPGDTWQGPTGFRKIPGNTCKGGKKPDEGKKEWKCSESSNKPQTSDIIHKITEFKGNRPREHFYLDNTRPEEEEETVILMTDRQEIWVSQDHGKEWKRVLEDEKIVAIYPHTYQYDHVYFITKGKRFFLSENRGKNFRSLDAHAPPNQEGLPIIDFNQRKKKSLIWTGAINCDSPLTCQSGAWYTKDSTMDDWKPLASHTRKCQFIRGPNYPSDKLIFCEVFNDKGTELKLVASEDFFDETKEHFKSIVGFAKMEEFIVVAGIDEKTSFLKAFASVDGKTFAHAKFPHGFDVPKEVAYTVLESNTNSVFLHVTVSDSPGGEYGALLKSNSNGTNYVLSKDAVNRDERGYVDFEKLHSLEGVILINRVENAKDAAAGDTKKIKTYITHNDGNDWGALRAPEKDCEGKTYKCNDPKICSLNLHHYTERKDPRHTFSSPTGVGLMVGVGNVGEHLTAMDRGDTFMTRDGGMTWTEVRKGQHFWEYGDQGSIIVIVDRKNPTDTVHYTLDEGKSWHDYKFGEKLKVLDLTTVPSDTSRKFIVWGTKSSGGERFYTVHLDFSGIATKKCVLAQDENKKDEDDFYLWKFEDPNDSSRCLFGHIAQYNRKEPDHRCYIGQKIPKLHKILQDCICTKDDYECDYNYERTTDKSCKLVPGLEPPNHQEVCKNPGTIEYYEPTGFRRLPTTTCKDGPERFEGKTRACPGKEKEYENKHRGISGFGLFMAIVFPIAAAAFVGWYMWTHVLGGRFGAIRLGESDDENPFVRFPVIAISAVVAVAAAIPSILSAIGGWVGAKLSRQRRYTTRSSFAQPGGYSIVNTDEGELLGASDDEDDV